MHRIPGCNNMFEHRPFHVMLGRERWSSFTAFVEEMEELEYTELDGRKLRAHVKGIIPKNRCSRQQSQGTVAILKFVVGEFW